jgi:23S rRNA G2445 N2-methylase RlmL
MVDPSNEAESHITALRAKLHDPGYTPGRRDVRLLITKLGAFTEQEATLAERALVRLGASLLAAAQPVFSTLMARATTLPRNSIEGGAPPGSEADDDELTLARLLRAVGRTTRSDAGAELVLQAMDASSIRVRKEAATQLGKMHAHYTDQKPNVERKLLEQLAVHSREAANDMSGLNTAYVRALIEALGKVGSRATQARLSELAKARATDDHTAGAISLTRAVLRVERTAMREEAGTQSEFRDSAATTGWQLQFNCRAGLEGLVGEQLAAIGFSLVRTQQGCVVVRGGPPTRAALAARCFVDFGFLLDVDKSNDAFSAVVSGLSSEAARTLFAQFGSDKPRVRIALAANGRQRKVQWELAAALRDNQAHAISDPTQSEWEVRVQMRGDQSSLLLIPNNFVDSRFNRVADIPAASHPTLAAALVALAGQAAGDVVWDPFVGSGTELLERAESGPYVRMFGTDIDERALRSATANLERFTNIELRLENCLQFRPGHLTTIVTNPPMGRRVLREKSLFATLDAVLSHGARLLTRGGRFVWFTPRGAESRRLASSLDLQMERVLQVDMGGFMTDLQVFEKTR